MSLKRIAVYCGASRGKDPIYMEQGYALGKYMAEHNYELVFGAGSVGIMGAIQNGVLDHGGSAIGVMPRSLDDKEITSQRLTDLVLVDSLHGRKAKMSELADAFVLAPGGAGSLEEFFETYSWAQIGIHDKPMAVFNINGFFKPLQKMLDEMIEAGFIDAKYRALAPLYDDLDALFEGLEHYEAVGTRSYD
ncbi:lysine decarboxlyase family protein [Staphylococcus piscifermentans]|uniref:Cytokinin riboside 5'-monophosphate phosphoribohydrolase n=1 Tax=Staphylococcus piscifermentans TaxID=70258 RepID=A0A239UE75_9STAP|nr:TIGR00730 family Rossman fold protein [Staphylococcus piscifermentans]GEP83832.1 cytokinin riboside 5'-monophosphate phosphoribohydrolase [Staphylococcus piscifermentans]SNV08205.1 lysine decarboxlyase family protein [Staphylococcus piscifermentans]